MLGFGNETGGRLGRGDALEGEEEDEDKEANQKLSQPESGKASLKHSTMKAA